MSMFRRSEEDAEHRRIRQQQLRRTIRRLKDPSKPSALHRAYAMARALFPTERLWLSDEESEYHFLWKATARTWFGEECTVKRPDTKGEYSIVSDDFRIVRTDEGDVEAIRAYCEMIQKDADEVVARYHDALNRPFDHSIIAEITEDPI